MTKEKSDILLKSTAVVIDDEINDRDSKIFSIIKEMEEDGAFFVKLEQLPDKIDSLKNVSFIILDWKYSIADLDQSVSIGSELSSMNSPKSFISKIIDKFYIPIFIFSAEDVGSIKTELEKDEQIRHSMETGRIALSAKDDLQKGKIDEFISTWLMNNDSAYLFKSLENVIKDTENDFFNEFDSFNKDWPRHVYNNLNNDHPEDIGIEFQSFILSTFSNRLESQNFEYQFEGTCNLTKDEIKKIYNSIKLVTYNNQPQGCHCGDLYCAVDKENADIGNYIINITASCDMRKNSKLILFGKSTEVTEFKNYDKVYEHTFYQINDNDSIVFGFDSYMRIPNDIVKKDNKALDTICIKINDKEYVYKRIGRVLHPYITSLQDRFAFYIARQGVTKTPKYN